MSVQRKAKRSGGMVAITTAEAKSCSYWPDDS